MALINKSQLYLISLSALLLACACSSKKETGGGGSGGSGYQTDKDAGDAFDPNTYCNGLFKGQICNSTFRRATMKTVNMLLVLDESGSMNTKSSSTAAASKWVELKQALAAALTSVQDDINFGLKLFPFDPNGLGTDAQGSCAVPTGPNDVNVEILPGASNLQTIISTVQQQTPAGGTPTTAALSQALAYFTTGNGKDLTGTKWVLLATDGGPNCDGTITCQKETCTKNMDLTCADGANTNTNCCDAAVYTDGNFSCLDNVAVVGEIKKLAQAGVKTYVIGIPGSEAYAATLNEMADAGQVPNQNGTQGESYYAVSASDSLGSLTKAFEDITTKLVRSCDIQLDTSPTDPTTVQVAKDCELIPMLTGNKPPSADGGAIDGFYINYDSSPAHLILTGSICASISLVGAKSLDVIEGCVPPP